MGKKFAFYCEQCDQMIYTFTGPLWGITEFNLIESLKFLIYHATYCGADKVKIIDQESPEWKSCEENGRDLAELDSPYREKFLKETADIFPSSNDWKFLFDLFNRGISDLGYFWLDAKLRQLAEYRERSEQEVRIIKQIKEKEKLINQIQQEVDSLKEQLEEVRSEDR